MRAFICALLFIPLAGCSFQQKTPAFSPTLNESRLIDLIAQRLSVTETVAWAKYVNMLPVYDVKREAEILEQVAQNGERRGIPTAEVQPFFAAQMKASREYQAILLEKWNRGGRLPAMPLLDLKRDIRPQLDAINDAMLPLIAKLHGDPAAHAGASGLVGYAFFVLRQNGIPWLPAQTASSALQKL